VYLHWNSVGRLAPKLSRAWKPERKRRLQGISCSAMLGEVRRYFKLSEGRHRMFLRSLVHLWLGGVSVGCHHAGRCSLCRSSGDAVPWWRMAPAYELGP
jgi:hypothetical protein